MTREWSTEELSTLGDMWGTHSVAAIALSLGRSKISVQQRGYEIYGSPLARSEGITITELARTLGIGREVVWTHWVKRHGMPYTTRTLLNKRKYRLVDIDAFWKWAKTHQDLIDTKRFPPLVLGEEPAWMADKRRRDGLAKSKSWTGEELFQLRRLLSTTDMTYKEIGERLGRSETAVRMKMRRMIGRPRKTAL